MPGFIQSPNRWTGRRGHKPEAIVIHICDGGYVGCHAWLLNPTSQVSAHYIVRKDGCYDQLVKFEDTAWHCGVVVRPTWKLLKPGVNPNLYTLGIEIGIKAGEAPTKKTIAKVVDLVQYLCGKFEIPCDRDHVIGHCEIDAAKSCPGKLVDVNAIVYLASLAN